MVWGPDFPNAEGGGIVSRSPIVDSSWTTPPILRKHGDHHPSSLRRLPRPRRVHDPDDTGKLVDGRAGWVSSGF
jgi:hypothetical protein